MRTLIAPRLVVSLLAVALPAAGCIEAESGDSQAGESDRADSWGGSAGGNFYDCSTEIRDARTGKTWRYDTSWFNNTIDKHRIWVSQNDGTTITGYPPLELRKLGTDTWQDPQGKVTLKLQQNGANKTIVVTHHSIGLVTAASRGSCEQVAPSLDGAELHSFFYGGRSVLDGKWRAIAAAGEPVASEPHVSFEFDMAQPPSDPYKDSIGFITFQRRCDFVTHSDLMTAGSSMTPSAPLGRLGNVGTILGFKFLVTQLIELGRCALDDDGWIDQTLTAQFMLFGKNNAKRYASQKLVAACGQGADSLYMVVQAAGSYNPQAVACMSILRRPGDNNTYLRIKAASAEWNADPSAWITFIRE